LQVLRKVQYRHLDEPLDEGRFVFECILAGNLQAFITCRPQLFHFQDTLDCTVHLFGLTFLSWHRSAETYRRHCTYVFSELCSIFQYVNKVRAAAKRKQRTQVIMVAYEYTYQDHEYIIRTVNTKHEQWCGVAFLLQAAHKIAVSCPKTFIVSCLGK